MRCRLEHVKIKGVAAVVPPRVISIDDEISFFDNNPKKLERAKKIVGYGTRHVVDDGVTALDLCEAAARNLLGGMGETADAVDALVLVNQSPDHIHPAGSCILHGRLGLPKSCATLDVGLGCSGYVYGLWLAHALIASGAAATVLLLAGDTPSLHSDRRNRLVNPLFGDAGSATLLARADETNPAFFSLGSDGTGWRHIAIPAGGFRLRADADLVSRTYTDAQGNPWKLTEALLAGMPVFDFTLHEVPPSITAALELAGLTAADIDFFALHQANKQIVQAIGTALDLAPESVWWRTFPRYGNQSTASVAAVLCDALEKDMRGHDLRLLLSGFGVGLSWASAVLRFDHVYNGGIRLFERPPDALSRDEQIAAWTRQFLGENAT